MASLLRFELPRLASLLVSSTSSSFEDASLLKKELHSTMELLTQASCVRLEHSEALRMMDEDLGRLLELKAKCYLNIDVAVVDVETSTVEITEEALIRNTITCSF